MFRKPNLAFALIVFLPFIVTRIKPILLILSKPSSLSALIVFFALSFSWSVMPSVSLERISTQVSFVLLAYLISIRFSNEEFFKGLLTAASLVVVVSFIFCLVYPGQAYTSQGLRSFYPQKNQFGLVMALSGLALIQAPNATRIHKFLGLFAVALICVSMSKTSIFLAVLCLFLPIAFTWIKAKVPGQKTYTGGGHFLRILFHAFILSAIACIVVFRDSFVHYIWSTLEKDFLTGRGTLWLAVLQQIRGHSLVGIGPGAFWQADRGSEIAHTTLYQLNDKWVQNMISADGSYIDLLASLGTIGLALFLLTIVDAYRMIARNWDEPYVKPMASLITFAVLHGITESTVLYSTNIVWFVYMTCFVRLFMINCTNLAPTPWQRLWGTK